MANDNIHTPVQRKVPEEYDQSFFSRFVSDILSHLRNLRTRGIVLAESIYFTDTVAIFHGTGTPESAVTAGVGSLFLRTDGGTGTTLYVKESGTGNTGWVAK